MIFESLAPNEVLGFEVLSVNRDPPEVTNVRCDQCPARTIKMHLQPVVSKWLIRAILFLTFIGAATAVYLAMLLAQFLILATPYGH